MLEGFGRPWRRFTAFFFAPHGNRAVGEASIGELIIFLKYAIFLIRKMIKGRKIPTEKEMLGRLRSGGISLAPLSIRQVIVNRDEVALGFDAVIEASWAGKAARFVVECKALWTPKVFQSGVNFLKNASLPKGRLPLLFLPFLSEGQLQELEQEGISGIDLCGNGVVVAPGRFAVWRGGGKNLFSSSAPIKNVYRKNSSLVGRVLLVSSFATVSEIRAEVNERNPLVSDIEKIPMGLSTVSKVLKTLEDDLIIVREDNIRLLQPDKLLEKLADNYSRPNVKDRVTVKAPEDKQWMLGLMDQSRSLGLPLIATGASSVGRYAVMERGDVLSVYCSDVARLLDRLPGNQTDRFPNLEIIETDDETVFFDGREADNFRWASPVQAYLELMAGDKRDRETAEQVKSFILQALGRAKS